MHNRVELIGRLGADPEKRFTQNNTSMVNMRIATTEKWKDRDSGERKEHTEWHRVLVVGPQADACSRYLRKGRLVHVEGKLRTREWEDKDGNRRWTTEVKAHNVQFLGSSDEEERTAPAAKSNVDFDNFTAEEIPF